MSYFGDHTDDETLEAFRASMNQRPFSAPPTHLAPSLLPHDNVFGASDVRREPGYAEFYQYNRSLNPRLPRPLHESGPAPPGLSGLEPAGGGGRLDLHGPFSSSMGLFGPSLSSSMASLDLASSHTHGARVDHTALPYDDVSSPAGSMLSGERHSVEIPAMTHHHPPTSRSMVVQSAQHHPSHPHHAQPQHQQQPAYSQSTSPYGYVSSSPQSLPPAPERVPVHQVSAAPAGTMYAMAGAPAPQYAQQLYSVYTPEGVPQLVYAVPAGYAPPQQHPSHPGVQVLQQPMFQVPVGITLQQLGQAHQQPVVVQPHVMPQPPAPVDPQKQQNGSGKKRRENRRQRQKRKDDDKRGPAGGTASGRGSRGADAGHVQVAMDKPDGRKRADAKERGTFADLYRQQIRDASLRIQDIAGHLVEYAKDQHGSRFIQQQLEMIEDSQKDIVFQEVIGHSMVLMTDVFGNYVIQKLLDFGLPVHREALADVITNSMLDLTLQMYGCRVVQKAFDVLSERRQLVLLDKLRGNVMGCITDQNGNHVVQKCLEKVGSKHIQFIVETLHGHVASLSVHPYGCRVVQRALENCTEAQKTPLLEEITVVLDDLIRDQYGNYVVQHVLRHGQQRYVKRVIDAVRTNMIAFSRHKFASNVVEGCLRVGSPQQVASVVDATLANDEDGTCPLDTMMKDQFANYVVQRLLEKSKGEARVQLVAKIRDAAPMLRRYNYGKHILNRLAAITREKPSS